MNKLKIKYPKPHTGIGTEVESLCDKHAYGYTYNKKIVPAGTRMKIKGWAPWVWQSAAKSHGPYFLYCDIEFPGEYAPCRVAYGPKQVKLL